MHNGSMGNQTVRRDQLYELHRIALINVHYYAERIALWTRINFWIQLFIAISSSAALAAMVKVKELPHDYAVWVGGAASILAIYHSSANITAKIGQWERSVSLPCGLGELMKAGQIGVQDWGIAEPSRAQAIPYCAAPKKVGL